jgi:hypothetical protein
MLEILVREEAIDNDLEHIAATFNHLIDVLPVVTIPLYQRSRRNSWTVARRAGVAILEARLIRIRMSLYWGIVCTSLDHGLECQRVQIYSGVFEFNAQDMAHERRD